MSLTQGRAATGLPPGRDLSSAEAMPTTGELDHRHLWHPFTQMSEWREGQPLVIDRAERTDLIDSEGRRYIDGVSSLWCNVHGHRHPLICLLYTSDAADD